MVLSLRDKEAISVPSAAASLATKSFWKTGHAGGDGNVSSQALNRTWDTETGRQHNSYAMTGSVTVGSPKSDFAMPAFPDPIPIQ